MSRMESQREIQREAARRLDEHVINNMKRERELIERRWKYLAEKKDG